MPSSLALRLLERRSLPANTAEDRSNHDHGEGHLARDSGRALGINHSSDTDPVQGESPGDVLLRLNSPREPLGEIAYGSTISGYTEQNGRKGGRSSMDIVQHKPLKEKPRLADQQPPMLLKARPIASVPRLEKIKSLGQVLTNISPQTWLRVDKMGSTDVLALDKFSVAMALGVQPRDLRLLDPRLAAITPPAILSRERAIVVNLAGVKCIITLEYVLVADPVGKVAKSLLEDLRLKLSAAQHQGNLTTYPAFSRISAITRRFNPTGSLSGPVYEMSFELKVLEICLDLVVYTLKQEADELEEYMMPALERLTQKVESRQLDLVRRSKNQLTALLQRLNQIQETIERVLEDDPAMWRLNLAAQQLTRQESCNPHEDPEDVLGVTFNRRSHLDSQAGPFNRRSHHESHGNPFSRRSHRSHDSKSSRRTGRTAPDGASLSSSSSSGSSGDGGSLRSMSILHEAEVAEVEMLLEAYSAPLDTCLNKLRALERFVTDTEELVGTWLDTQRNRIIAVDLVLTSIFTVLAVVNVETGLFGISIRYDNFIDEETYTNWMIVVLAGCVGIPFLLLGLFLYSLNRQQLVSWD